MTITLRKMLSKTFFLLVISDINAVKVNLQGQITLGRDIMDSLSFIIDKSPISGRRTNTDEKKDVITTMVTSKELCADLKLCTPPLKQLIEDYTILLINGIESIFNTSSAKEAFSKSHKKVYKILDDIKNYLKKIDGKINKEKEFYYWNGIIKKISAKFQNLVISITDQHFKKTDQERKSLLHKLITAIIVIEHKYLTKLCTEHKICIELFECTKTLYNLLKKLTNLPEDKIRHFIKHFNEALFQSNFYFYLSNVTTLEFQSILKDMAHSSNIPTRSLLLSVEKTVGKRLELIKNDTDVRLGYDVLLIHTILSDLDQFYSSKKEHLLQDFTKNFDDWIVNDHLGRHIREAVNEIGYKLSSQSKDMYQKVKTEVQVFLELTIDPEK